MKPSRRQFLQLTAGAAVVPTFQASLGHKPIRRGQCV